MRPYIYQLGILILLAASIGCSTAPKQPAHVDMGDLQPMDYQVIKAYEIPEDRAPLIAVEQNIRQATPQQNQVIERLLLRVIKAPDATYAAKDFAFRMIGRLNSATAVPALEPYLYRPSLSHMARYALQHTASPEADAVLRRALKKSEGEILIGVIGSVSMRGDEKAVPMLAKLARSENEKIAVAAVKALGRIQSEQSLKTLIGLDTAPDAVYEERLHSILRLTR